VVILSSPTPSNLAELPEEFLQDLELDLFGPISASSGPVKQQEGKSDEATIINNMENEKAKEKVQDMLTPIATASHPFRQKQSLQYPALSHCPEK
jgi:hypothetical protein